MKIASKAAMPALGERYAPTSLARFVTIFVFLCAAIGEIGYGAYAFLADVLKSHETGRLEAVADLKSKQIELWLAERYGDANVLVAGSFFSEAFARLLAGKATSEDESRLLRRLDSIREAYGYPSIELFDLSGAKRLTSGMSHHADLGLHLQLPKKLASSMKPELVDFHRQENANTPFGLSIAVAAQDAKGAAIGIVLLNIDPSLYLFPMVRSWPMPGVSAESLLVRREGNEVVFVNPLRHSEAPPLSLRFPLSRTELPAVQAATSGKSLVEGSDYRRVPVMAATRRIANAPWFMVAKIDQDEIFHDVRLLAGVTLGAVVFVIAFAGIMLMLLWRQQRLAESHVVAGKEDVFRSVLDNAADAVFIATRQGRYIYANHEAVKLVGYEQEELLAMTIADILPAEDRDSSLAVFGALVKTKNLRAEVLLKHKSGRTIPVEINAVALPDNTLLGSCRDISERRANESRMQSDREQQAALKGLLESVLMAGSLEETLQRCLDQLLAVSWLSALPKAGIFLRETGGDALVLAALRDLGDGARPLCDRVPAGLCLCGRAAASGEPQFAEHVDERHDIVSPGMPDHGNYAAPLMSGGIAIGVLVLYMAPGTSLDPMKKEFLASVASILVAYLSRSELERELAGHRAGLERLVEKRTADLAMTEARTRAILRTMMDGVVHIDKHGVILMVNDTAQEMFGYEEAELLGRNIMMLMPQTYRHRHETALLSYNWARSSPILGKRIEMEGLRKDGGIFPLDLATNELVDDAGNSFIGVLRDISQRKLIEAEREAALAKAERLAQAKSAFLASMSHEIRTPLNAVLGVAQIGMRESADPRSRWNYSRILDAGRHLLGVINDILDFSKIEVGKLAVETRPFKLAGVVQGAVELIAGRAGEKGLALPVAMAPDLPGWVEGDPLRLEQVLINLLSNAVKFTERGEVSLNVAREGEFTLFRVTDTGIGMTDEQVSRLFVPFAQADGSITRKFGGTGLGLAISRTLAELMGGTVSVESRFGEGSVFTLRLPLRPVSPGYESPERAPVAPARLAGLRVLAAEDNEVNRMVLEDLLAIEGAHVVFAEDGRQALARLEEQGASAFDVVLMDVQMPVMDGYEATRGIREKAPDLPVIGLTAHAMLEERERCRAAGMVERITKPVDADELVATILQYATPLDRIPEKAAALIDWPALSARYGGRQDFIGKLIVSLLKSHGEIPARLRAAALAGDMEATAFIAHGLKSMAGNIEAASLGDLAKRAEQSARARQDDAAALAGQLAQRLEAVLLLLNAHAAQLLQKPEEGSVNS